MNNLISLVQSSIDKYEQATRIADTLIEEKLCACIHIVGPMTSIYRWDGRVVSDREYLLNAKTARAKVSACKNTSDTTTYLRFTGDHRCAHRRCERGLCKVGL